MKYLATIISSVLFLASLIFFIDSQGTRIENHSLQKELKFSRSANEFKSELLDLYMEKSDISDELLTEDGDSIIIDIPSNSTYGKYAQINNQIYVKLGSQL